MPLTRTDGRTALAAIMEYSPIGMVLLSLDGRCLLANRAVCELLGYSREEMLVRSFRDLTHPEDVGVSARAIATLASQQATHQYAEKRYLHRDGHEVWGYVGWSLIPDDAGQPGYIIAQVADITDRKRHEAEREEMTQMLQLAIEASGIGIWSYDFDTDKTTFDARMNELWGRTDDSSPITRETWLACIHPDDRAMMAARADAVRDGNSDFELEHRIVLPDGRIRHLYVQSVLQRYPDCRPRRLIGTNWDMTDQIEAAEVLRRARDEAESASKAKSRFLANMSHELRTPLNAIIGFSEAMKSGIVNITNADLVRSYSADIHASGRHLLSIINDLLDLSRIEAGRFAIETTDIDLRDVINDVANVMRRQAEEAGLTLVYDIAGDVPAARADERAMRQILLNLLSNAVKFTPAGGQITCGLHTDGGGRVRCWVADTGIGIAAKDIPRLMQPFAQVTSVYSRQHQGAGLGLAIVRALVSMQGGEVALASEPGKGTAVTVTLPESRRLAA
ncbi:sensor histidine kinase [Ferrovibrio xuzhouensis]|uniref:histidine kinase n=1 Tax=Ferrovibrio xuzhouensis TaxID=1576914 RepID=A0ABV7VD09_9PROT